MLRSTYKPSDPIPLPPGWTEHKAPSGHSYYYHSETKTSTYKRPPSSSAVFSPAAAAAPPSSTTTTTTTAHHHPHPPTFQALFPSPTGPQPPWTQFPTPESAGSRSPLPPPSFLPQRPGGFHGGSSGDFRGGRGYQDRRHRPRPEDDRPKHRFAIPGCEPWVLVKTRLGRRFVHNPESNESFWKFPGHVLKGVVEFDRLERERRERRERGEGSEKEEEKEEKEEGNITKNGNGTVAEGQQRSREYDSDEYEEVEVTDDEGDDDGDDEKPAKRHRIEEESDGANDQPMEFNEDDIAYQLEQMGQDYDYDHLDDYEADDGDEVEDDLTEEDSAALFRDLLEDFRVNPYRTWEQIIEDGQIVEDPRYVALPSTRARKEFYSQWSKQRIQELREQREREEKLDPRIRYVAFLDQHATPKLYWPEFRRKFQKEPEMKDRSLADKDKEKMYRDHINRLKLPESTRKSDLTALLKSTPSSELHAGSTRDTLPTRILTDLRFISLPPQVSAPLIEAYISTLPPAAAPVTTGESAANGEEEERKKADRERREKVLAERERRVKEEKRRQQEALRRGKALLGREEAEIEKAMRIERGQEGLKSYMEIDGKDDGKEQDTALTR